MKIKITYPSIAKKTLKKQKIMNIVSWLMVSAAIVCPIINFYLGGKPWCLIVLMGLYTLWTMVMSPDLVEYNRLSQFIKFVFCLCALLAIIDIMLLQGWAIFVVPIILCGGLCISGVLFFTDLEKQKQNMFPMLLLIIFTIIGSVAGMCTYTGKIQIVFFLMGFLALALLAMCIITLGHEFIRELKRRFHIR